MNLQGDFSINAGLQLIGPSILAWNVEMATFNLSPLGINHGEISERLNNINFRRTDAGASEAHNRSWFRRRPFFDWGYSWGSPHQLQHSHRCANAFLANGMSLQATVDGYALYPA